MLKEAISEICAEIRLLSKYASSFEHESKTNMNDDVTMLFSGLCLLSTHAERLMEKEAGLVPMDLNRDWDAVPSTPERPVSHKAETQMGEQHGWIADVVKDLAMYARQNDMGDLSEQLDGLLDSVFYELHFRDLQNTLATSGGVAAGNVISLEAQMGLRKSRTN